jgi:thiosulfate reductase cytochrome b subunit
MSSLTKTKSPNRWRKLAWIVPLMVVVIIAVVLFARWLRSTTGGMDFIDTYPGRSALPGWAPVGFPAWLAWQHAFNAFFIILIARTGWQVRTQRKPPAYWTRNNVGAIRTRRSPKKISLTLWLHFSLDALWVLNGIVFVVLIFCTGQWVRIVPTNWDVFPNAVSAAFQYASLNAPTEDGWVNYNGLQLLSYFVVVFLAAPLAIVTGLRMSAAWPANARLNRLYPIEVARRLHLPTMIFFVLFILAHVTLVLATGALRNLNHMYAGRDDTSIIGLIIFGVFVIVMVIAWIAARPVLLRGVASLGGKVTAH